MITNILYFKRKSVKKKGTDFKVTLPQEINSDTINADYKYCSNIFNNEKN